MTSNRFESMQQSSAINCNLGLSFFKTSTIFVVILIIEGDWNEIHFKVHLISSGLISSVCFCSDLTLAHAKSTIYLQPVLSSSASWYEHSMIIKWNADVVYIYKNCIQLFRLFGRT